MTSAPLAVRKEESGRDLRLWLGIGLTLLWLGLAFVYIDLSVGWRQFHAQSLGDMGQFIEGAFAPLAFLWLVLGLSLQQSELSANNRAIQRQYELMQKTAEHAEVQTKAIAANELHARQDTFIELAKLVEQQLEVISGLLYLSSQGPVGDGVVNDEELDRLWTRMSSGESSIFSRRLIALHFRSAHEAEARDFFWGTPIRARHCDNFIFSFERLLRSASDCDPDGMIVDALTGNAQGRVYRIMQGARATSSVAPKP